MPPPQQQHLRHSLEDNFPWYLQTLSVTPSLTGGSELPEKVSFAQPSPKQGVMEDLSRRHGTKTPRYFQQYKHRPGYPCKLSPPKLAAAGSGGSSPCSERGDDPTSAGNYSFSFPGSPAEGASADVPIQQLPEGFLLQLAPAHSYLHPQHIQHLCHVSVWEERVLWGEFQSLQPAAGLKYSHEVLGQWVRPVLSIWYRCPKNGPGGGCSRDAQTGSLNFSRGDQEDPCLSGLLSLLPKTILSSPIVCSRCCARCFLAHLAHPCSFLL